MLHIVLHFNQIKEKLPIKNGKQSKTTQRHGESLRFQTLLSWLFPVMKWEQLKTWKRLLIGMQMQWNILLIWWELQKCRSLKDLFGIFKFLLVLYKKHFFTNKINLYILNNFGIYAHTFYHFTKLFILPPVLICFQFPCILSHCYYLFLLLLLAMGPPAII